MEILLTFRFSFSGRGWSTSFSVSDKLQEMLAMLVLELSFEWKCKRDFSGWSCCSLVLCTYLRWFGREKNVLNSMVFVFHLITFKMRKYQGQRWNKHFPPWRRGQSSSFSIFLLALWWLLLRRSQPWHSKFMTVRTTALLLGLRVSLTFRVLLFHCIHSLKFRQGLADLVICCKKKIFFGNSD